MDKRIERARHILRLRVGSAELPDTTVRRYMLFLFFISSALFLWTPTRWMMQTFRHFSSFESGDIPQGGPLVQGLLESPASSLASRAVFSEKVQETAGLPEKKPRAVVFRLLAPAAKQVFVGGTFNSFDARKNPMTRRSDGLWETSIDLTPGRYNYKFKVDGRWELDPTNPERSPEPRTSSLLEIR